MSDVAAASRALSEVRRLGVTVLPGDFGTGYSSLAYLARLPVDRIRMDKSFVQELTGKDLSSGTRGGRSNGRTRALRMKTVAEGIETEPRFALVKEPGCDAAQGYFIGKPVSAARIEPYAEIRFRGGWRFLAARRRNQIALAVNARPRRFAHATLVRRLKLARTLLPDTPLHSYA